MCWSGEKAAAAPHERSPGRELQVQPVGPCTSGERGEHLSFSHFARFDTCHIQGFSAPSCSSKILFWINTFLFLLRHVSVKRAVPPPCLSFSIAHTLSIFSFLFFTALCLFQALFLSRFSLIHRRSHMQIDRRVCVCVGLCVRRVRERGSCLQARVLCECGALRKNGAPGLLHDKSGSAGPCTRTTRVS